MSSEFNCFLRDITQAYTQANKPLIRVIFVEPPASLGMYQDKILRVIKPLYGLPESGLHWFETYHNHNTNELSIRAALHNM